MNQPKLTVELGYRCPRGLSGPPAVTQSKKLKYKKTLLLRCIHQFSQIKLKIWTICAFRVLNPRQLSLAKQSNLKELIRDAQNYLKKLKTKGMV